MDISDITDIRELKALAYDQMLLQEQIQQNLAVIHARIAEIQAQSDNTQALFEPGPED